MHGVVRAAIAPIAVHEQGGAQQRVIQRGVETRALRLAALRIHRTQRLAPLLFRCGAHAIEIPARCFRFQIGNRVVFAHRRNGDLHQQRLACRRHHIERGDELAALDLRALLRVLLARRREALVRDVLLGVVQLMAAERLREAHGEMQLATGRPATRFTEAGDRAIGAHPHARPQDLARVVIHAGAQVQHHMRRLAGRESVAMHANTRARGEFGADVGVIQRDGVIAGLRTLGGMAETRGVTAQRLIRIAALQLQLAGGRHQQQVAQVRMTGAGKVRMREPDDGAVVMAIPRRPAVTLLARLDAGIRRQLDHAVRNGGPRVGMALAPGTDEGVNGGVGRLVGGGRCCQRRRRRCGGGSYGCSKYQQGRAKLLHPAPFGSV
ncbi:hypothetical protein D3C81_1062770 [compost metagenome]